MDFYVSLNQITGELERLNRGFQNLAGRVFRPGTRSVQAAHDLFNQCAEKAQTLENWSTRGITIRPPSRERVCFLRRLKLPMNE